MTKKSGSGQATFEYVLVSLCLFTLLCAVPAVLLRAQIQKVVESIERRLMAGQDHLRKPVP